MNDVLAKLAARLEIETSGWKSIRLRVREEILNMPTAYNNIPSQLESMEWLYSETHRGQKLLDWTFRSTGAPTRRLAFYCDGTKCAGVEYVPGDPDRQKAIGQSPTFGFASLRLSWQPDRPVPLERYYLHGKPLHDLLPSGSLVGESTTASRPCVIVKFSNVSMFKRHADLRVSFDNATGVPLRFSFGNDPEEPLWTWEADGLESVDGYHIPRISHDREYFIGRDPQSILVRRYILEEAEFDRVYPASMFWPVAQEGVKIGGSVSDSSRKAAAPSAPEAAKRADLAGRNEPVQNVPTIEAIPVTTWVDLVRPGSLALGIALLIGGIVLWWRRSS